MVGPGRWMLLVAMSVAGFTATPVALHVPLQPPGGIAVQGNLNVGSAAYVVGGGGECNYAADASIFQAPAQMWSVRRRDSGKDVSLTVWHLTKGGEMFTLAVTMDGKTHRVNTLQVGPPADRRGSSSVTIEPEGKGARFTVNAVADTGLKIAGTLSCSGFTHPEENGN